MSITSHRRRPSPRSRPSSTRRQLCSSVSYGPRARPRRQRSLQVYTVQAILTDSPTLQYDQTAILAYRHSWQAMPGSGPRNRVERKRAAKTFLIASNGVVRGSLAFVAFAFRSAAYSASFCLCRTAKCIRLVQRGTYTARLAVRRDSRTNSHSLSVSELSLQRTRAARGATKHQHSLETVKAGRASSLPVLQDCLATSVGFVTEAFA